MTFIFAFMLSLAHFLMTSKHIKDICSYHSRNNSNSLYVAYMNRTQLDTEYVHSVRNAGYKKTRFNSNLDVMTKRKLNS